MKCPKCGRELRQSKKNPEYGLCDNCKKRFLLKDCNADYSHKNKLKKEKIEKRKTGCVKPFLITFFSIFAIYVVLLLEKL